MQLAKKHHWTSTSLAHSSQFCFCVALESVVNQHNSNAVAKYLDYESPKQDQETQSRYVPLHVCKLPPPPPPSTGLVLLMFRSGSLKGSQSSCWMSMNVNCKLQLPERRVCGGSREGGTPWGWRLGSAHTPWRCGCWPHRNPRDTQSSRTAPWCATAETHPCTTDLHLMHCMKRSKNPNRKWCVCVCDGTSEAVIMVYSQAIITAWSMGKYNEVNITEYLVGLN